MNLIDAINKYAKILETNETIETPLLDCKLLLCHVLNIGLKDLYLKYSAEFVEENKLNQLVQRRLKNEPISKILNRKSFWDYDFYVNGDVLDPRPDTENIVELVLEEDRENEKLNILDLGTGSGCLILTFLKIFGNSRGVAVDINEKSLNVARANAEKLNVNNIDFVQSNWNDDVDGKFDIIVSNPPYIRTGDRNTLADDVKNFDPLLALDGGDDGLNCYRYIAKNIAKNCKFNTKIFLEIGQGQEGDVTNIFVENGFVLHRTKKDLNGIVRVLSFIVGKGK